MAGFKKPVLGVVHINSVCIIWVIIQLIPNAMESSKYSITSSSGRVHGFSKYISSLPLENLSFHKI